MSGLNRKSGTLLEGQAHLQQSIQDILTTPLNSRVMRPDYGSRLFDLVDAPLNNQTLIDIYAATAEALMKWEPRIQVKQVRVNKIDNGQVFLDIECTVVSTSEPVILRGLQV